MERKPITPFAISAKQSLVNLNKPQIWLENEIANDTGLYVDSGVLYKIWTGKSKSKKIITSICGILNLPLPTDDDLTVQS